MNIKGSVYLNIWKWGLAIFFLFLFVGPLIFLFGEAIFSFITDKTFKISFISISLFLKTIVINALATLICCTLGVFSALSIWTYGKKYYKKIFIAVLLCALIPPFIHVHSWIKVMDGLTFFINNILGTTFNFTGEIAVVWTTSFSYLPYTLSFCLMGLFCIPKEITDLMKIEISPKTLFKECVAPYFIPYVFISALLIFLITMNDYAIPSAFNVNVFALELFSLYSASGNIYSIAFSCVPLIILSGILLLTFAFILKRYDISGDIAINSNPFEKESFMKHISTIGGVFIALFIMVPVLSMIAESYTAKGFWKILSESGSEILYSFWVSACVAFFSVIPSTLLAYSWYREKHKSILLFPLSFPFLIPSAILGLSLIAFWNNGVLSWIYQSQFMPVIGLTIRFSILSMLFLLARIQKIDKGLIDAVKLSYSFIRGLFVVIIPMIWKDIITCLLLTFALAMGEYGIVLLVTPPGFQMLTIKIYNYLHYGATEVVYALNLFVFAIVFVIGIIIFSLYNEREVKTK